MPDMRPSLSLVTMALMEQELEKLEVQVAFWKQAAQQAHDLWAKQEAVSIVLRAQLLEAITIANRRNVSCYSLPGDRECLERLRSEAEAE